MCIYKYTHKNIYKCMCVFTSIIVTNLIIVIYILYGGKNNTNTKNNSNKTITTSNATTETVGVSSIMENNYPPLIINESTIYPQSENKSLCYNYKNETTYSKYIKELNTKFYNISFDKQYMSNIRIKCFNENMNVSHSSDYDNCRSIIKWGYNTKKPCIIFTYKSNIKHLKDIIVAVSTGIHSKDTYFSKCLINNGVKEIFEYRYSINTECEYVRIF